MDRSETITLPNGLRLFREACPEAGWSSWGRETYWRLREHLAAVGDPRTARGRHSRALRGAQVAYLRRASDFAVTGTQLAEMLGTSPRSIELARADLRAITMIGAGIEAEARPIPTVDQAFEMRSGSSFDVGRRK